MNDGRLSERELLVLIEGECNDTLASTELNRLELAMRSDAKALELYRSYALLDAELYWLQMEGVESYPWSKNPPSKTSTNGTVILSLDNGQRFNGLVVPAMIVLGCLWAVMAYVLFFSGVNPSRPNVGETMPVAVLTGEQDCDWQSDRQGRLPYVGQQWQQREALVLRSGIAELAFADGARIAIEGPTELEFVGSGKARLRSGKLAAHVPPRAVGFEIETATTRIVDLGTEFRMAVDAMETRFAVTSGKTDLVPAGDLASVEQDQASKSSCRLTAGQAVAVTATDNGKLSVRETEFDPNWLSEIASAASSSQRSSAVVAYQTVNNAAGNKDRFRGGIGLDFDVRVPIHVYSLGVFDHLGDGIDSATSPTVQLWSRNTQGTPNDASDDSGVEVLASQAFKADDADDAGELKLGYRFKSLKEPTELPVGSYSIVAYGLSDANPFIAWGNASDGDLVPHGRWAFDNNLNDSAGSNNGTFNGGKAAYAPGKISQAINLDGTDDHIEIPYSNDPTALTMTAWVKPTDVTSVNIMSRGSANINEGSNLVLISGNSKFEYLIHAKKGNHLVTGTTTVQPATWYHVAVVATNNDLMRLYVNGVEEGTAQSIATMWNAGDRFRVGVPHSVFGLGHFEGLVDDLRIYEQALSDKQIKAVYEDLSPLSKSKKSEARGRIETWHDSIVPVGSRIGVGEPGMFPATSHDTMLSYGAGSFEYCPQNNTTRTRKSAELRQK